MLPMPRATKLAAGNLRYWLVAGLLATAPAASTISGQEVTGVNGPTIDLTSPGDDRGNLSVPGASVGGPIGDGGRKWLYTLPLTLSSLRIYRGQNTELIAEVVVKNMSDTDFRMPVSKSGSAVEKAGNKSRRIMFFRVEGKLGGNKAFSTYGGATVAESSSVPGSWVVLPR